MTHYLANLGSPILVDTFCKMYSHNSSSCNQNVHINPVFNHLASQCTHSSAKANVFNLIRDAGPNHSSKLPVSGESSNSFNEFIKKKFYELSNLMYEDSINRSTISNQEASLSSQNSEYPWKNQKYPSVCDTAITRENVPFQSAFSKGWFFHNSCDTECIGNSPFDVQSCCFINNYCLPQNTLNMQDLKKQVLEFYKTKTRCESNASLVSISKHKLVKKTDARLKESTSKTSNLKRRQLNALVLCTRSKLIRKNKPNDIKSEKLVKNMNKNFIVKRHSLVRVSNTTDDVKSLNKRKRLNSRTSSPSSVIVLTKRKLIRKNTSTTEELSPLISVSKHKLCRKIEPKGNTSVFVSKHKINRVINQNKIPESHPETERLISLNPNKLIRSSLLPKINKCKSNTFFANSVLYHVIRHRRRIHRGSGYVLLTRNKLIKKAKFKNKTWRKSKIENKIEEISSKNRFNKMFVSLGDNKLIRKSLFSKNNKIDPEKKINQVLSPIQNTLFARMLNSPSRRIQRFTNHMTRTMLRYASDRNISLVRNRFSNKHKNNKRIIRKKRNLICPIYRKRGTCAKLLKGECTRIHDRKYVALCKKFIRGSCDEKDCVLSHDLVSNKISICLRFLKNSCSTENCPYLHVKPTLEAPICLKFLQGYCDEGETCSKWHIYACPEFKENSRCSKENNCRLPHRDLNYFQGKIDEPDDEDGNNWRYFEKNKIDEKVDSSISIIPERQSLGDLPEYIPL